MHRSVKGLLIVCLLIGQLIGATAQDITCPAPYQDGCDMWSWGNQAEWHDLCNSYASCGAGMQSPIDIPATADELTCGMECVRPVFSYSTSVNVGMFNLGQTLAVVPDPGNNVVWNDVQYDLQWIEFRQPSEHTISGVSADFEAQFYHQSFDGAWLAIAVLYDVDADEENVFFASFWDDLPEYDSCACGNGRIDGFEACDDGMMNSNTIPDRCRLDCTLPVCGDGVKDRTEECDAGILNSDTAASTSTVDSQKACRTDCLLSHCGDGVLDAGEECDDGALFSGDGCSAFCESECGNGRVDGGEQCDEGTAGNADNDVDGCRPDCRFAYCGDGVVDSGEECDNGARNSNIDRNACRTNCVLAFCGDGVVDNGEQCDPLTNPFCTSDCVNDPPPCGNGIIETQFGESCDAGNGNSDTSARCRTDCTLPFCGDGIRDNGVLSTGVTEPITYSEDCDVPTGSTTCNPLTCTNTCGDGNLDLNEECDLGGGVNTEPEHGNKPNQCRKGCVLPTCGDGIVDQGEDCDEGASNGSDLVSCDALCRWKFCGDGELDSLVTDRTAETCDDGNNNDNDGCSSVCQLECGDGHVTGLEECDRGSDNRDAPNECKTDCMVPVCGDGYVDFDEECDYNAPGQSLATCRSNCKLPYCGDGQVDSVMGEECDDGFDGNSDILLGGCSTRCTLNECGYANNGAVGDLNRAMACDGCFYMYMGSTTRPPCVGGVTWLVAQKVQKISQWQIDQFNYIWGSGVRRNIAGSCQLEDRYSPRECMCASEMGSVTTMYRMACWPVERKPALQTAFDLLRSESSSAEVQMEAIKQLVSLLVREPLVLPTYYTDDSMRAQTIACETEAFYTRGLTDLTEAVDILRASSALAPEVQAMAFENLVFFEHVLQFYQALQVLTADRTPDGALSDALALMIGSGAASPFLPYNMDAQTPTKENFWSGVTAEAPLLVQRTVGGIQARLFRGSVGYNIDPELHRYSNIPGEQIWHIRFVGVEYMKQYGYRNNEGVIEFNISTERVILESNLLNLWNFNQA